MPGTELPFSRVFADRAEECRALAETFRNREARDKILKVAHSYDQMAQRAAERELADAERNSPD